MKKFIRFDSVGGASGDMVLSALVALGADIAEVEKAVNAFFPEHVHFHTEPASGAGLNGVRVTVHAGPPRSNTANPISSFTTGNPFPLRKGNVEHHHHHHDVWPDADAHHHHHHGHHGHTHRGLKEIASLVEASPLPETTRKRTLDVFTALAEAEAKIHGKTPDTVHFHEVGAWDSVADITGACIALEQLGVCGVSCGPLPAGTGTIRCAHGEMPNPAPATQELLAGMSVVQTDEPFELVTPTGAALLRTWTRSLERVPQTATVLKSAFGFGRRTLNGRPNVLRATLMAEQTDTSRPHHPIPLDTSRHLPANEAAPPGLLVMETNIDDCNPEWIASLADDLLKRGALDVWQTPIVMKKGRMGVLLGVLASADTAPALRERIFRSTTTFGIRFHPVRRETLERRMETAQTPYGEVPVKLGFHNGERITAAPEHDACNALAQAHGVPVRKVYGEGVKGLRDSNLQVPCPFHKEETV